MDTNIYTVGTASTVLQIEAPSAEAAVLRFGRDYCSGIAALLVAVYACNGRDLPEGGTMPFAKFLNASDDMVFDEFNAMLARVKPQLEYTRYIELLSDDTIQAAANLDIEE